MLLLALPVCAVSQGTRNGLYGNRAIGYGSYTLDLYEYAGGADLYNDQHFSGPVLSLGIEKKSAWQKNNVVFDLGGELTGNFGISTDSKVSGNGAAKNSSGYGLGVKGLFKAGYSLPNGIVPLVGLGPYFTYLNSGVEDADGNYIYGIQASLGVDFPIKRFVITPEIAFGVASWGGSDEMGQNGQPGLFEVKIKVARRF